MVPRLVQNGETDKYVRYLETHLGRSSREYVELIQCCCDAGDKVRAREIAEQGLKQCKEKKNGGYCPGR